MNFIIHNYFPLAGEPFIMNLALLRFKADDFIIAVRDNIKDVDIHEDDCVEDIHKEPL